MDLIWPWDHFAVVFATLFVLAVYIFAFWPRKRDEEINSPHEDEQLVRSSEAEYFGDIEGVEISKFSGPTNLDTKI